MFCGALPPEEGGPLGSEVVTSLGDRSTKRFESVSVQM